MDSRLVQPGDVYLAVPGAHTHGAAFAAQVAAAGAVAIVTDAAGAELAAAAAEADAAEAGDPLPVVVIDRPRERAGELADVVYGAPSADLIMVGLTGTNGKTTMSFLIESIFDAAGMVTGVIGTTGHHVAGRRLPTERTTPEAVEVHGLLAHMREQGVQAVVMEVSSHAMAFGRVAGVRFNAAVFTNLTQDHLDFHGTMEDYFEAKALLFGQAERRVICIDDQWGRRLADRWPDAVTYGVHAEQATWRARDIEPTPLGSTFRAVGGPADDDLEVTVGLPGDFNVANALGAIASARALGLSGPTAAAGVAACAGVPGRMQSVANDLGIRAYVDYAHTPDAVERAVEAAGGYPGRVIALVGCGGDRDVAKRPLMGAAAARLADIVVITDDNPRSEDPAVIRAATMAGAMEVPSEMRAQVLEIADRREAIAWAVAAATPGDAVLLLGKGHEQGQTIGSVTLPFDDVTELATALAKAVDE